MRPGPGHRRLVPGDDRQHDEGEQPAQQVGREHLAEEAAPHRGAPVASAQVVVHHPARLHRGVHGRRADEDEPVALERPREGDRGRGGRRHVGEGGRRACGGSARTTRAPRRDRRRRAAAARRAALVIAARIFSRLRTIPASAISRATSRSSNCATTSASKPAKASRNAGALAQDGQPGQAGLERLEGEALEQRGLAVDRRPPLVVVVVEVVGGAAGPGAAPEPVGPDHDAGVIQGGSPPGPRPPRPWRRRPGRTSTGSPGRPALASRRPRAGGRRTSSSVQCSAAPAPPAPGSTDTSAQPSSSRPILRSRNRARPSRGGSHEVITMTSANRSGPTPDRPAKVHPTRVGPSSSRIVVSGIQRA